MDKDAVKTVKVASGLYQPGFHDPSRCGVCNPNFQDDVPVVGCFENASPDEGMPYVREDDSLDRDQSPVSPSHYDFGNGVESIDIIFKSLNVECFIGFCMGNILKYLHRAERKGWDKDLRKAAVYARWMVEALDGKPPSR